MFRPNIWLAWNATVAGRFSGAMIVTSCTCTVSPGFDSSQLPPVSAARSTITEPGAHRLRPSPR